MWIFYFLFWTAVRASEQLYRKIGGEAVLTPDSVLNPITSITWKHGSDIAMEWNGGQTESYRQFKDRGSLDILTGVMTITGLTRDDSGIYTAEINNKVNSKTQLLVISPVPKPTLTVSCDTEMTYCVFTCDGNTTDAEPVEYWWTAGDRRWPSTYQHRIRKEEEEQWFICAFDNPVSFISSEKVLNPFIEKTLYGKIGDKVVLKPDSVENPITNIRWKHGHYIAMERYGDKTIANRQFKDRGSLDISTGVMTITGLTRDDSGIYTAEINNKETSKTQLLVISAVPEPNIPVWCDPEMTSCVLTCSGSITGAEPVTYRWTSDETRWNSTKELKITKDDKEWWFSCTVENPVSSHSSEKVFNPFMKSDQTWMFKLIAGVAVILFLCILIIIIFFLIRTKRKGDTVDGEGFKPQWQFERNGEWCDFKRMRGALNECSLTNDDIQKRYQEKPHGKMRFTVKGDPCELDFKEMIQTNLEDKTESNIRVVLVPPPRFLKAVSTAFQMKGRSNNTGFKPQWQYERKRGGWHDFRETRDTLNKCSVTNDDIQRWYQENSNVKMSLTVDGKPCELDFKKMILTNLEDKTKNKIRRMLVPAQRSVSATLQRKGRSADKELAKVRAKFVVGVDSTVINRLLDDLIHDGIMNDGERGAILKENRTRADRARSLIDTVKGKGNEASKKFIAHLYNRDPLLHKNLRLSSGQPVQSAAEPLMEEERSTTLIPTTAAFWRKKRNDKRVYTVSKDSIRSRVALLINNIEFTDEEMNRKGSEKDEENMEELLKALGYEVLKYRNLTEKEIEEAVSKFSKHPKLKKADSVFVVIMSHGKQDKFPIDDIYKHLDTEHCPDLLNKPKIIIIQAERGEDIEDYCLRRAHIEKDFICFLSCTPDTVSYRHTEKGSFFIQYIVDVLNTFAHQDHIEELFRRVMQHFEEDFPSETKKQMPTKDRCTLLKNFYLFPQMTPMLSAVQESSNQDSTSVVTHSNSNRAVISTVSEVDETPAQEQETTEAPNTSNDTEKPSSLPAVEETSTQKTTSAAAPETSNETEMEVMLPAVKESSNQDLTSVVIHSNSNEAATDTGNLERPLLECSKL